MRAVVQRSYGEPATLEVVELPDPGARGSEVLVRVAATSVNMADLFVMTGEPRIARAAFGFSKPRVEIQGRDVAGTIVAVGPGVSRLSVGDEVMAECDGRAWAELVAVDESFVALKPRTVSFEQAATLPLAGGTALQGVRALRGRVLVTGASGGVGSLAVQIARHFGAAVTGECSARSSEFVRSLGAEGTIDYAMDELPAAPVFDAIFDLAGQRSTSELFRALRKGGTLVLSSGAGGPVLGPMPRMLSAAASAPFAGRRARIFTAKRNGTDLAELAALVDAAVVTPAIDTVFALADVRRAVEHFRDGHPRGKVVLSVG